MQYLYNNIYNENYQLNEEELYDLILEYLIDEGYTTTFGGAEIIFENVSDEFRENLIETVLGNESRFRPGAIGRAVIGAGVEAARNPMVRQRVSNFARRVLDGAKNRFGNRSSNDDSNAPMRDTPLWYIPGGSHPKDPPRQPSRYPTSGPSSNPPKRNEPLW